MRGRLDHMPTAERRAPQRDAGCVDAGQLAGVLNRGGPVLKLPRDVDVLAWPTTAGAKAPLVEKKHPISGRVEASGEGLQTRIPGPAKTVSHHDTGPRGTHRRRVQPAGAVIGPA